MNYEKIGTEVACEEMLEELPDIFNNFVLDLEEEIKCTAYKYSEEANKLEGQISKFSEIQKIAALEKNKLKAKAVEVDNQTNSSFFFYSEKELNEELRYNRKVIKYAKSKIRLYELCEKVTWNPEKFSGEIVNTSTRFDFSEFSQFEQVNKLWELM